MPVLSKVAPPTPCSPARWRPLAAATALATAAAFSIFEGGVGERNLAHAAGAICAGNNGEFDNAGALETCTTTRAGVIKIVARGAGGAGVYLQDGRGGAGAVVTTYQFLPRNSVLQIRVGSTSYNMSAGGSATSVRGTNAKAAIVAGGGGGGGTSGFGGHGAEANTAAGGSGKGGRGGQGGLANGRGGNGGNSNHVANIPQTNGHGGAVNANGKDGVRDWGGGGGGAGGRQGGKSVDDTQITTHLGGVGTQFGEAASYAGGGGATFGGGGAGGGAGGGGYGGGGGGATIGGGTSGGGAGGSYASPDLAAYGFSTTYRPGGNHLTPKNGSEQSGSVSISFVQANEKPRPQTVAGSCKNKIPVKQVRIKGKKKRTTTVLPANCKTVAGYRVTVSAKWYIGKKNVTKKRTGKWLKRKRFKNGKVNLIAKAVPKRTKVVLTYAAPRNAKYNAYRATKTIRIRK